MVKKSKKIKEEEEDLFDSDEESDDYQPAKRSRNAFVDVEAEVDEDEDEDFEDDEEYELFKEEFIANEEEEEAKQLAPTNYQKISRKASKRQQKEEELDLEAEERRLKELYGAQKFFHQPQDQDENTLPDQFLLPTPSDPKLWLVKCRPGKERTVVHTLMRKSFEMESQGTPLLIQSVLFRENLRGYIYVEASKQAHVTHALSSVHNVFLTKISLVPMAEMPHVLRYESKSAESAAQIQPGQWVRIKRGKYSGDLGIVADVLDIGETIRVKLIPRLAIYASQQGEKPPQKLFNPQEISQLDAEHSITKSRGYWMYMGETYLDGYLEKDVKCSTIMSDNVTPTIEELTLFKAAQKNATDEESFSQLLNADRTASKSSNSFLPGDSVVVTSGEFVGITGKVICVNEDSLVIVQPVQASTVSKQITLQPNQLRKSFNEGDHVQVIAGVHKGESGLLVKIDQKYATLFSDISMSEYTVFVDDLCEATHSLSISNSSSPLTPTPTIQFHFDLFDFVQMTNGTFGVIYRIAGKGATVFVLDLQGISHEIVLSSAPSNKLIEKNLLSKGSSVDIHGNVLNIGDQVEVLDGQYARSQGSIFHIFRNSVFVRLKNTVEKNGLVVVRNSNLLQLSASTIAKAKTFQSSSTMPAFQNHSKPMDRPQIQKSDFELLNRTVTICSGPYKGYLGIVKSVQNETASIELHTTCRVVTVDRNRLIVTDDGKDGVRRGEGFSRKFPSRAASYASNREDVQNISTGYSGGKTPSWEGGKTPSWEGGKTPSWEGGKTPSWSGGKTPSWEGGKTPNISASSFDSDWSSKANSETTAASSSSWDSKAPISKDSFSWESSKSSKVPSSSQTYSSWDDNTSSSTSTAAAPLSNWDSTSSYAPPQDAEPIVWGVKKNQPLPAKSTSSPTWIQPGCFARVTEGIHSEKQVVISQILSSSSIVCKSLSHSRWDSDTDDSLILDSNILEPVQPPVKDSVRILSGEWTGLTGAVMSVDGKECIVKMDSSNEMNVIPVDLLVKIEPLQ